MWYPEHVYDGLQRYLVSARARGAIKRGKLVRRPCEECGNPKSHGHHEDYSKPFEVRWLCARHHRWVHMRAQSDKFEVFKCLRCGWEWGTRYGKPKRCSKCRTPYWDTERKNGAVQADAGSERVENVPRRRGVRVVERGVVSAAAVAGGVSEKAAKRKTCPHGLEVGYRCTLCGGIVK